MVRRVIRGIHDVNIERDLSLEKSSRGNKSQVSKILSFCGCNHFVVSVTCHVESGTPLFDVRDKQSKKTLGSSMKEEREY